MMSAPPKNSPSMYTYDAQREKGEHGRVGRRLRCATRGAQAVPGIPVLHFDSSSTLSKQTAARGGVQQPSSTWGKVGHCENSFMPAQARPTGQRHGQESSVENQAAGDAQAGTAGIKATPCAQPELCRGCATTAVARRCSSLQLGAHRCAAGRPPTHSQSRSCKARQRADPAD